MNCYLFRLAIELEELMRKQTDTGFRRPMIAVRMARLRKLLDKGLGRKARPNKKYAAIYKGRACRVPFRFKFERY